VLKVEGLVCRYGKVAAVRELSIEVNAGELVSLIGANGAGKTTTLKAISGVLAPAAGRVTFLGEDITRASPRRILQLGIAHCPEGRRVFPHMSVLENLEMGSYLRTDASAISADMQRLLERFPILHERRNQAAGTLSGGEQQMLAISRALMARPHLMLLDEPSLGLSPKLVKDIFEIIVRINRERGVTILLVEQNANMALQTADFGYVLEVGRIVMADTCERLLQKEDIKEFYLGIKDQGARGKRRWKKRKTWR
jgi:branched-chain amino acid transport system ATP-binding protein